MITAIGNPVYDLIKTKKVNPGKRILSGCSTNAALALSKMGEKVRLVGAVGHDFREQFKREMDQFGIEHRLSPSEQTGGFSLDYYDDFGNRTLDIIGRAAPIDLISPGCYSDAKAVLIGPILGEVSFDQIRQIRESFEGLYFCDPQGLIRNADENDRIFHEKVKGIEEALGHFDIVKPNELEGKVLTGIDCREDPYKAAKMIHSWGPKIVIVTLAELGSIVYDGETFYDIPAYDVNLLDSTGAGDTYMAGFVFEWLKTQDIRKSACFATATSSIMIENTGPEFEMTEAMLRSRQEQLLEKIDFHVKVAVNQKS